MPCRPGWACTLPPRDYRRRQRSPAGTSSLQVAEKFRGVSYLRHSTGGLSSTRNAGLALARGDYVAFTDDGSVAHPRWLVSLLAGFAEDSVGCVTGLVLRRELETDAQIAFEFVLGGFSAGFVRLSKNLRILRQVAVSTVSPQAPWLTGLLSVGRGL